MCHITPKQLVDLLFALRELYSAEHLSQLLGVHRNSIHNWESSRAYPHKTHLRRILQLARQSKIVSLPASAQAATPKPIAANG